MKAKIAPVLLSLTVLLVFSPASNATALGTAIPGMESIMTAMMKAKMKAKGVASLEDLRELCQEAEVKFVACQMTVDLFDMDPSDFISGLEFGGAATFFEFAGESDICLYI